MDITDYIEKFGDKELSPYNLNLPDVLVLTALSYIDFSMVSDKFSKEMILSDAIDQLFAFGISQRNQDFLINLRQSKRFSGLHICGYRNEYNGLDNAMQFSVLTIKISDSLWFISYSGTDGTIVGWKEDFQFSYLEHTPAQDKALMYLNEAADSIKGRFIISGHSKGGNLAAYASVFTKPETQSRINAVYCNDAPGFNKDVNVFSQKGYSEMSEKMYAILPHNALIGQILQTVSFKKSYVINSNEKALIYQHNIFSWQINPDGSLDLSPSIDPAVKLFMEKINSLIGSLSMKQREEFTKKLFDAFESKNIRHVSTLKPFMSIEKYFM